MKSINDIQAELKQFIGSCIYYKSFFGILYTDGVKYLAENCQCYWLIDAVASWQYDEKVKSEEFQIYKLFVNEDKSAKLQIEDGNYNVVQTQEFEFTDFPLRKIELWFSNGVLYLPSEH
mgnify:CR=1 FL=1